jgi:Tripartite tricarboxylate transporter family receptor
MPGQVSFAKTRRPMVQKAKQTPPATTPASASISVEPTTFIQPQLATQPSIAWDSHGKPCTKMLPPTLAELGVKGMDYEQWFGVLVPAGTLKAVVDKLKVALAKAASTPNAKERLAGMLMDAVTGTPEEFKKRLEGDAQRWVKLAADMGIKPLD